MFEPPSNTELILQTEALQQGIDATVTLYFFEKNRVFTCKIRGIKRGDNARLPKIDSNIFAQLANEQPGRLPVIHKAGDVLGINVLLNLCSASFNSTTTTKG